ncbi:MAG: hypothetical protein MMC33_007855 [Icmadophila ericetorum]|nr:hypothetical protein [Icmadophila ericetorum]
MDHKLARINVLWLSAPSDGGQYSFHVKGLSKHLLDDENGIRAAVQAIKNILDHGADPRLQRLCEALDTSEDLSSRERGSDQADGPESQGQIAVSAIAEKQKRPATFVRRAAISGPGRSTTITRSIGLSEHRRSATIIRSAGLPEPPEHSSHHMNSKGMRALLSSSHCMTGHRNICRLTNDHSANRQRRVDKSEAEPIPQPTPDAPLPDTLPEVVEYDLRVQLIKAHARDEQFATCSFHLEPISGTKGRRIWN